MDLISYLFVLGVVLILIIISIRKNHALFPFIVVIPFSVFLIFIGGGSFYYLTSEKPDGIMRIILFFSSILFSTWSVISIKYAVQVSRQKFFSLSKLQNALKIGLNKRRHIRIYYKGHNKYNINHVLLEDHCFILLSKGEKVSKYYLLASRTGEHSLCTKRDIIKEYLGWPGIHEGLLLCKKAENMKGIYNVIAKNQKEGRNVQSRFPEIANLVNNTIDIKRRKKDKPYLSFENDGTPMINLFLPYIRYERYYINGEIPQNIDEEICRFDNLIEEIAATYQEYIISKEKKWPKIAKLLVPVASMFLFGIALPDFLDFFDETDNSLSTNSNSTPDDQPDYIDSGNNEKNSSYCTGYESLIEGEKTSQISFGNLYDDRTTEFLEMMKNARVEIPNSVDCTYYINDTVTIDRHSAGGMTSIDKDICSKKIEDAFRNGTITENIRRQLIDKLYSC